MNQFLKFLCDHWRIILEAVMVIASVVICCIRKKPVKVLDTVKEFIVRLLPGLISLAENTELKGDDKKEFVFAQLKVYFTELGYDPELLLEYKEFISSMIEQILSTPTKKGINYGKKSY